MNAFKLLSITCLTAIPVLMSGQSFSGAQASIDQKLEDSLAKLADTRSIIRDEKIPLSKERQALLADLKTVRRDSDKAARVRDNASSDLTSLSERVDLQKEEIDYVSNLSSEYIRMLESRLDIAELPLYTDNITEATEIVDNPGASEKEKLLAQLSVIDTGIDRVKGLIGGMTFPGMAVTQAGTVEQGTFGLVGPVSFFASDDGSSAGITLRGQSLQPTVETIAEGSFDDEIAQVVKGEVSFTPLDSSLTNAIAIASTKESLVEHIQKGGLWVYPILGFAIVSLIVAAFKAVELYTSPAPKSGITQDLLVFLNEGKKDQAMETATETKGPVGEMLQVGVKYSHFDTELLDEMMYERIVETQPSKMRLLPFISVTAAVAPLLGLLGTVTGMINTFNRIKIFGTGDAKSLSGGISEALITTEFGLVVAIPSLILYAILSRKAKGDISKMERISMSFLNGLKAINKSKQASA
ncbi:MotA/TolQ/ExbB proton channel family protein [Puniceicoccaceae bacterium K14]|nr:MotA/TolQ/ExbB proton channel family protein [Puniceicoccaceae bacterium K14]